MPRFLASLQRSSLHRAIRQASSSIGNEYFNDIVGQRTGYKTQYSKHLIGWGRWIGATILIRPKLRFEHAYNSPAYNNGSKKSQLVFASDAIYHF